MKRIGCITVFAIVFSMVINIGVFSVTVMERFVASEGFSSVQGDNNWYYQQYDGRNYKDLVYDNAQNLWRGDAQFLIVFPNSHHPTVGLDSVRRFVTPSSGIVRISGKPAVVSFEGDGVIATISHGRKELWSHLVKGGEGIEHEIYIRVKRNESIYFSVNCNEYDGFDTTIWNPVVEYVSGDGIELTTGEEQDVTKVSYFSSSFDFESEQGVLGWSYLAGFETPLEFDDEKSAWVLYGDSLYISGETMYPSEKNDAVRMWTVKRNGKASIQGNAYLDNPQSDGVSLKILKGETELYSNIILPYFSDSVKFKIDTTVEEDDKLFFVVGNNGNPAFDSLKIEISIDFSLITTAPVIDYGYDDVITARFDSFADFSSQQGGKGWFYEQNKDGKYSQLLWLNNSWKSTEEDFVIIEKEMIHPGNSIDTVRKWVAPQDGFVAIRGRLSDSNPMGDGVIASVFHNDRLLWKNIRANRSQRWNDPPELLMQSEHYVRTYVRKGDCILFELNCRGNNSFDATQWNPVIDYINFSAPIKATTEVLSECNVLSVNSSYAFIDGIKIKTDGVRLENKTAYVSDKTANMLGLELKRNEDQPLRELVQENSVYIYWHNSGLIFISEKQMNIDALNYSVLSEIHMLLNNEEVAI